MAVGPGAGGGKMSAKQRIIRPCPICRGGRDRHPKIPCWSCLDRGTIHDILDRATRKPYTRKTDG